MNKKIKFTIIGIVVLLAVLGLVYSNRTTKVTPPPNNNATTTSSSTPLQVVPTSTSEFFSPPSSTADIDQNNPATWPRYFFKELGFSIQAPVPLDKVSAIFHDCTKPDDRCDNEARIDVQSGKYLSAVDMYWFGGKIDNIIFSSFSKNYASGGDAGLDTYDLVQEDARYFIVSSGEGGGKWEIHPIKIFSNFKTPVIYFDIYRDYIKPSAERMGSPLSQDEYQYYGVVFKLPYSKKFKAITMMFNEKKLTQNQFISILNTLNFE